MRQEDKKVSESEKSTFNGWYVVAILAAITVGVFLTGKWEGGRSAKPSESEVTPEAPKGPVESKPEDPQAVAPAKTNVQRNRLEAKATKRLPEEPQVIKTVLMTTGRGENANWGLKGMYSFVLTYSVVCHAEIIKKEETALGEVKVLEKRTYETVKQELQLSKIDVALALRETLPIQGVSHLVDVVSDALAACGLPGTSGILQRGGEMLYKAVEGHDGKSIRGILGMFGFDLSPKLEKQINEFVQNTVKGILKTHELEGKSYLITYYQDKDSGAPLRIDFTYADGTKIKTEEEWLVLRRANVFMDSKVIPDKNCSPGDSWQMDSADFDCLLDPFVEGSYCGEVEVVRLDDDADGNWQLSIKPGTISILSDRGRGSGEVQLDEGRCIVDGRRAYVKAMTVTGKGAMKHLTKHHLLFRSRFEGECGFRAVMTTEQRTAKPAQ